MIKCNPSSIHDQIIHGNVDQVNQLIENGAEINCYDQLHWTPLHLAIRLGKMEIVKILLNKRPDIEAKSLLGLTPLHFSVMLEDPEMVKILLLHGANVNATCQLEKTPLHYATEINDENLVEILLNHNSDVNAHNEKGLTPLTTLLQHEIKGETSKKKICKIFQLLLENNARHLPEQILLYASSNGLNDLVEYYFANHIGADFDKIEKLIYRTISEGYDDLFHTLLTHGTNQKLFDAQRLSLPLIWTIYEKRESMAKMLISIGANVNLGPKQRSHPEIIPINVAMQTKSPIGISSLLLQNGAIVNTTTCIPPIFYAIQKGSRESLELLIEYGAELNSVNSITFQSPLFNALELKKWDMAKLLIAHGAKTKPEHIFMAINYSCIDVELLEIMISKGSDVNFKSPTDLMTPLHLASLIGLSNVAKILLENGACANHKDSLNKTALEYALIKNQKGVYKNIITFMASLQG